MLGYRAQIVVRELEQSDYEDLIGGTWTRGAKDPHEHDCWGVVQITCERRGIAVPDFRDVDDHTEEQAITEQELPGWVRVRPGEEQPGDVGAYSFNGNCIDHVGVLCLDNLVLHSRKNTGTVLLGKRSYKTYFQSWYRPGVSSAVSIRGHQNITSTQVLGDKRSGFVVVRLYRNALNPDDFETHVVPHDGGLCFEYLPSDIDLQAVAVSVNGGRLSYDAIRRYHPKSGDEIKAVMIPGVTGAALAGVAAGAEVGFGYTLAAFAINSLLSLGISFFLKALTAPPKPSTDESPVDQSPTFSQAGIRNSVTPGGVIPIVIGEHRIGGQIIGTFNSISELTVSNFQSGGSSPTTNVGPFSLKQNTNSASATGGKTTLNLLIAVSEGEIEAINGLSGDFDDVDAKTLTAGNLLINGNDASEYSQVLVSTRMGWVDQEIIPGFGDTVNAAGVEINLKYQQPWQYTTTQDVDAFEVQLFEPAGHFRIGSSNGKTKIKQVFYRFAYRAQGSTTFIFDQTIERTYLNRAAHSWKLRVDNLPRNTYEIILERLTFDDDDQSFIASGDQSEVSLATINAVNEITYGGSAHPGIAVIAVKALATDQLNGTPTVTSLVKGKKWWVWDGVSEENPNFTFQYTNNPGEFLPGFMLNRNFGLGNDIAANQIDYAAFATLATDCANSIDDGRGGTMNAWETNYVYDSGKKAGDFIDDVLTTCRSSLVPIAGKISVKTHKAKTPSHMFSEGSVSDVKVVWVDETNRPNRINVTFPNEELDYELDTVSVENQSVVDGNFIEETVTLLGVTKPARAMRHGQHRLNVAGLTKTLEFRGALDSVLVSPGDVFWFNHQVLSTNHISGRVVSSSTGGVVIDRDVVIAPSTVYKIRAIWSLNNTRYMEEVSIMMLGATWPAGSSLVTGANWTNQPPKGATYLFGPATDYIETYEVVECPLDPDLTRHVKAIQYDATVFDDDPGDVPTATDELFDPRKFPQAVTGVKVVEETRPQRGTIIHTLAVSWKPNNDFEQCRIYARNPLDDTAWEFVGEGSGGLCQVHDFERDVVIEVSVVPVSPSGNSRAPEFGTKARVAVKGRTVQPGSPTALVAENGESGVSLRWAAPDDVDLDCYKIKIGDNWAGGILVATVPACQTYCVLNQAHYASGSQVFLVKAVSKYGVESDVAASVDFEFDVRSSERAATIEDASWKGTATDFSVSGANIVSGNVTTASYLTDELEAAEAEDLFVAAHATVEFRDRTAPTWATAEFTWGSKGGRVRNWANDPFTDFPDTQEDARAANWANPNQTWVSALSAGRNWAGLSDSAKFDVQIESRTATSSGALSSASQVEHKHRIDNASHADVELTVTVPHSDYQAVVTSMESSLRTPAAAAPQRFPRYCEAYNNAGSSTFTTWTKCNLTTIRDSLGDFSLTSNQIVINFTPRSGKVRVYFTGAIEIDADSVTKATVKVYHNDSATTGAHQRPVMQNSTENTDNFSGFITLDAESGDVFDMRANRNSGSANLKWSGNTCNIRVEEVLEGA